MDSADNLSTCLVLNTVSAARVLLRRYDQRLKAHGVTVQLGAQVSPSVARLTIDPRPECTGKAKA